MSLVARIEALIEERGLTAGVRLPSERTLAAELGVGMLAEYLATYTGGLKAVVRDERAKRRAERRHVAR